MKKILFGCLSVFLLLPLCSCSIAEYIYPNAENYSVGDTSISGKVSAVELDWPSGEVILRTGDAEDLLVSETSNMELTDEYRLHYWLDGEVLRIHYTASGIFRFPPMLKKTLTLTLPASLSLDQLRISTASAKVTAENVTARDLSISTASGRVNASASGTETVRVSTASGAAALTISGAKDCSLSAASGNLTLISSEAIEKLTMDTASGDISVTVPSAGSAELNADSGKVTCVCPGVLGDLDMDTASGSITCELGEPGKLKLESASGKITARIASPGDTKIESASGTVRLTLPADAAFVLDLDTASGELESDFAYVHKNGKYICGDGGPTIRIETASGNVFLTKAN